MSMVQLLPMGEGWRDAAGRRMCSAIQPWSNVLPASLACGMMGTPSASTVMASRDLEMVAAEGGLLVWATGGAPAAAAAAASSAASAANSAMDCRPSTVTLLMQKAGRRPGGGGEGGHESGYGAELPFQPTRQVIRGQCT